MKLALAILLLGSAPASEEPGVLAAAPPDPFVLSGYVPGGFVGFGAWTARKATQLVSAPGSGRVVATVSRCEEVTAEDGELRGHPWALHVLRSHAPFHKGEKMWILARGLEEGYLELWYRGRLRDEIANDIESELASAGERCSNRSPEECWLWIDKEPEQEHWVRMHSKDGTIGWTNHPDDFAEGRLCP